MGHQKTRMPVSDDDEDNDTEHSHTENHNHSKALQNYLDEHDLFIENDNIVNWRESHPDQPRFWGPVRKINTTAMIIWLEFFMTFISTSGTTASEQAQKEYGYSSTLGYFAFVTLYLLAQALGGILVAPISEKFGRRTLYLSAAAVFCVGNIIIAGPHSFISVFFGRFLSGFVASIPANVAFGNFDDMYDATTRIWIVYFYTLFGNTGIVLGPIYASYISQAIGWRWIFWIAAIASGISIILSIVFLSESKASALLATKVKQLQKQTGTSGLKAAHTDQHFSMKNFLTESLYRPLFFLATEPLVFFCAILCSIAFALFYGETESLTIVYTNPRLSPTPFNETNSSLAFIAVLIGLVLDILPRFYDAYIVKRRNEANQAIIPEHKIGGFAVACPAIAVGLWIFGWTIPPLVLGIHWIVSMIGLVLIGFAANDFAVVLFGYITDSYGPYAASAASALSLTRTLAAAVFPLFVTQMYNGLGANIATTIFAAIATLFAFTPILFLRYGKTLRRKSKWAITVEGEDEGEGDAEKSGCATNGNQDDTELKKLDSEGRTTSQSAGL